MPRVGRLGADLRRHLARLERSVPPGEVHEARVAARRLGATLEILKEGLGRGLRRRYARDLRRLVRLLGPVREADVRHALLRSLLADARLTDAQIGAARALLRFAAQRRTRARADLRAALAAQAWRRLRSRLEEPGRVRALAAAARSANPARLRRRIRRRHRRLEERMSRPKRSARRLHRLRLAVKELRYSYEGLGALCALAFGAEIADLRRLQHRLGEVHDLWLLRKWLRREAPPGRATRSLANVVRARARRARRRLVCLLEGRPSRRQAQV